MESSEPKSVGSFLRNNPTDSRFSRNRYESVIVCRQACLPTLIQNSIRRIGWKKANSCSWSISPSIFICSILRKQAFEWCMESSEPKSVGLFLRNNPTDSRFSRNSYESAIVYRQACYKLLICICLALNSRNIVYSGVMHFLCRGVQNEQN